MSTYLGLSRFEDALALLNAKDAEIDALRQALESFARRALTRKAAQGADDNEPVTVSLGQCRAAQKAMAAAY